MTKALIIVDIQNDYCKNIKGIEKLIKNINKYILKHRYNIIIFTKDWFSEQHCQFKNSKKYVLNILMVLNYIQKLI